MTVAKSRPLAPAPALGRLVAAAFLIAAAARCSGISNPSATYDTVTYNSALYALNGTPVGAATAINTATAATVRADAAYDFDVAFDLDASGTPVVMTQRVVGVPQGSSGHQVSLLPQAGAFASVVELPSGGWVADSSLTLRVGQVLGVRAGASTCLAFASPYMYSKMMVDSVNIATRQLWVTTVTDPNCGFRGVGPGRPTS